MPDFEDLIAKALGGDGAAWRALYSETVATVYYSSLRITGTAYAAHQVTVRTYLLAFGNLARLTYPQVFPLWLDRLSVYLAYHAAADRYSGAELQAARDSLIAFLRSFHRMSDAEIAELLALEEQAVTESSAPASAPEPQEFLMEKDAVLGIWREVCGRMAAPAAAAAEDSRTDAAPIADAPAEPAADLRKSAEYRKKRKRRLLLRLAAAALSVALIASVVYAALHAKQRGNVKANREVTQIANTLSLQLSGQVGEIYPLSEDTYYVSINLGYGAVEGLVVQYELADNAIRVSSPENTELTEDELEKLTEDRYMQVLYNPTGTGSSAIKAGSTDADPSDTPAPPDAAPTPTPTKTPIAPGEGGKKESFVPSGDYSIMLRINCRNVDLTRPMTIVLDSAISKAIGEAGGLQIALNDDRHCITLSTEQLMALCSAYGSVTLRFSAQGERRYNIAFYSETGKKITELFSTMTFTLPAESPLTYVFALYDSGTESRGGVFDYENRTISFPVYLSGVYELIGSEAEIRDAADMDAETAEAANFLASLEFMQLDDADCFRPDGTMTRAEAVSVIGRMFLATDPTLSADYSDVDFDDPSSAYISFGTSSAIITGLSDGTFHGEAEISREEFLTLCGRTLLYRTGQEAEEPEEPLGFDDESKLSAYARPAVAALLRDGSLSPGGALRPKALITRGEAALLLYRMYCSLYGYQK